MQTDNSVRCILLGGGGHARVLVDCIRSSGAAELVGILDADRTLWGKNLLDVPILGGDDLLPKLVREGATHFVIGLGSVKDNRPRAQLFEKGLEHGLIPLTVIHPSAILSPSAVLGPGSVLFPRSVVNASAVLGKNVIVNTGAIIEHDCEIGDHVHVATGAQLAGAVRVGSFAHIGAGATVRQCVSIGEGAVVAAGAVVVDAVDPWTLVMGVPAKVPA